MKRVKICSVVLLAIALLFTMTPVAFAQAPQSDSLLGETAYADSYNTLTPDLNNGEILESIRSGFSANSFVPNAVNVDTAQIYYIQSYVLAELYTDGSFSYYPDTLETWSSFSTINTLCESAYAGYGRVFYVTVMEAGSVSNQQAELTSGTLYLDTMYDLGSTWQSSSVYVGGITLQQYAFFSNDHSFKYTYTLPTGLTTATRYTMN